MSDAAFNAGKFSDAILETIEFRGERTLIIDGSQAYGFLQHCKDVLGYDYLLDISSVDNFGQDPRWEMVYELYALSDGTHQHLRVKFTVAEDVKVPSVVELWPTANWHEREVYDMMGIEFSDHPDLRRILMWDGYPFFPLRKDFPLAGRASDMPDVAFTDKAPLAGGPFVTQPTTASTKHREPRSRAMD